MRLTPERMETLKAIASVKVVMPDSASVPIPPPPMLGEGRAPDAWAPTYMLGELLAHIAAIEAENARLRDACQAAEFELGFIIRQSEVRGYGCGGPRRVHAQLRAALAPTPSTGESQ